VCYRCNSSPTYRGGGLLALFDKIHMPFNIKPFEIDNMKELKTSTFNDIILSKYIQDDSLMIKLVDKDDDIHYYQCNAKFSHWYGELNDKEVYHYLYR